MSKGVVSLSPFYVLKVLAKFFVFFASGVYLLAVPVRFFGGFGDWLMPVEVVVCLGLSGVMFWLSGRVVWRFLRCV